MTHPAPQDAAEPADVAFDAWLEANSRRMHCAQLSDEDCMREAWRAALATPPAGSREPATGPLLKLLEYCDASDRPLSVRLVREAIEQSLAGSREPAEPRRNIFGGFGLKQLNEVDLMQAVDRCTEGTDPMSTIWKYALAVTDEQVIRLPKGTSPLTAQMQLRGLQLWAKVDDTATSGEDWTFLILGTGNPAPDDFDTFAYLSTFQIDGGALVFHVFTRLETAAADHPPEAPEPDAKTGIARSNCQGILDSSG